VDTADIADIVDTVDTLDIVDTVDYSQCGLIVDKNLQNWSTYVKFFFEN